MTSKPPLPPFDRDGAIQKARMAENAWNSRDPAKIALAYSEDSVWRNRSEFIKGRQEIEAFLKRKWARELDYRLIKEVWAWHDNRIAVRFQYEFHDDSGNWYRAHGNENWEFDDQGLMRRREASINDVPIRESERLFLWPQGPRPDDHPGLSELGL
ncbi:nuclear transport factor 2 family protein [Synechococcus sp. CS-1328]|uniref:nuclear transport factor 2 family protein n=1 Tax=Synechococcus sp. CS-1328 TaxID=2847976 RepID=UPI00223B788F|nr:nuclear transport factor 2 family protein [Synechococcus sp. CS-1328]MCT0224410.1 nuclear transport factor 2 family protein [Synechococcus sp. CS-1328]